MASIEENLVGVPLEPGMRCFIDNYRAVHGRASFQARYDGTDRWLKRVSIPPATCEDLPAITSARMRG
ncbi:hypothetical protein ADL01_08735 [Streptomyces sp. NRRL WC-3618]|uniref:TauD/TfdA family dioxygenase n=1 Tax=Streptomyces sp. NRRL WC-3618 TaxID=1519490 RepID=UPI0006AFAA71|nr:TauD/TfdA family dioxygenase [Streptomyces sp. NRRL WC-3618]KOV84203.1 hypothetical protein ADL01_08735 [Streptomyces sp. NRRL WC-3618]